MRSKFSLNNNGHNERPGENQPPARSPPKSTLPVFRSISSILCTFSSILIALERCALFK